MAGDTLLLFPSEQGEGADVPSSVPREAPAPVATQAPPGAPEAAPSRASQAPPRSNSEAPPPPDVDVESSGVRVRSRDRAAARLGRRQRCLACGQRFGDATRYCPFDGQVLLPDDAGDSTLGRWLGAVVLDHYRLERFLGERTLTEIYEATDERGGPSRAVELLRHEPFERPGLAERFTGALHAARRLDDPRVSRPLEIGEHEGVPCFVRELRPGQTLGRLLAAERLDAERALHVAQLVAEGLAAAHDVGLVHGDLGPEQVWLGPEDEVWLLDLGLSAAWGRPSWGGRRVAAGTPEYMSPEVAAGGLPDARSDQYAFGALFYELLSGAPPFTGASVASILAKQMYQAIEEPRAGEERLPRPFEPVVLRCLAKRPARRFADMAQLLEALREARATSRASARPPAERAPFRGAALGWLRGASRWFSGARRRDQNPP